MSKEEIKKEDTKQDERKKTPLDLLRPSDIRVQSAIAPFSDSALSDFGYKDRKELTEHMFLTMTAWGGLGLTASQVGLPYNMFVMGNHPFLEAGKKYACFNPKIVKESEETIMMKEGCLTFPYLFLNIKRAKECTLEYEDEEGKKQTVELKGMMARCALHEYDHTLGRLFIERVSKFKLNIAKEKAHKLARKDRQYAEKLQKENKR